MVYAGAFDAEYLSAAYATLSPALYLWPFLRLCKHAITRHIYAASFYLFVRPHATTFIAQAFVFHLLGIIQA